MGPAWDASPPTQEIMGPSVFGSLQLLQLTVIFRWALWGAGWLGSRVASVLDSGAERPGFKSQSRCCRVTVIGKLFTVHAHRASVHQAAKLAAALLRVAGVTVGLAESNGSLPPGL